MQIVGRPEWLRERKALLEKEKELTRANDALSEQRRAMPMVRVEKDYTFTDASGTAHSLTELFAGKEQLIVYHFMFSPDDAEPCSGCTHVGESLPSVHHLRSKNTNLVFVSRAPAERLDAFQKRAGWDFPCYSSGGSDFNYDFYATVDEKVKPVEINFRSREELENLGQTVYEGDVPGYSVFCKKNGDILYSYSTFNRGGEKFLPTLALLDMTPMGRQEKGYGPGDFKLAGKYSGED